MNTFSVFQTAVKRGLAWLFPPQAIYRRSVPLLAQIAIGLALAVLGAGAAHFLPADGKVGYDWVYYFSRGHVDKVYPPWGDWVVARLTWEWLVGLTVAGVGLATLRRAIHPVSAICVLLSLPFVWTIFLGQLEGLITLGLTALPWLTPLGLLKPQVSTFAFGARRSYVVGFIVWLAVSLLLWPNWITAMLMYETNSGVRFANNISLRGWGLGVALVLMWFSRGDMDMLMFAGAFGTLHLLPYNLLPATPALARLKPRTAIIACLLSWLPLSANWLGRGGWWLGWLFIGYVWLCLAAERYPQLAARAWVRWLTLGGGADQFRQI